MKEEWRDIQGYEGFYQVSSFGNVRSLDRTIIRSNLKPQFIKGRTLNQLNYKNGYVKVELSHGGFCKRYFIHRLVAQAFIPNPDNLPEVNHKDENPSNNCVDNLEWCTHLYNSNYGDRVNKIKTTMKLNGRAKSVLMYDKNGKLIKRFDSINDASNELHIHCGSIVECCQGKRRKSAGGYVWRYE